MGLFDFLKRKAKPEVPLEAVFPWVHRRVHFEAMRHLRHQSGLGLPTLFDFSDGFSWCFAAQTAEVGPVELTDSQLERYGIDLEVLRPQILKQIVPALLDIQVGAKNRVCFWQTERELAGGVMLMAALFAERLPLRGRPVVMLPEANVAMMAGEDDAESLGTMLELAEEIYWQSNDYRSLRAVSYDGVEGSDWLPAVGHPLRARFAAAAASTRMLEAKQVHSLFSKNAPAALANLAALPASHQGRFVASWFRGADVLLPKVDSVLLLDTDDVAARRLEVDLPTLLETFPTHFEPLTLGKLARHEEDEEEPIFWRTRSGCFLSRREWDFMERRLRGRLDERRVSPDELLREWDEGQPILVGLGEAAGVRLKSPCGRFAEVPVDSIAERVNSLAAQDVLRVRATLTGMAAFGLMTRAAEDEHEVVEEAAAMVAGASSLKGGALGASDEELLARADSERPRVLQSHFRESLFEHMRKAGGRAASEETLGTFRQLAESIDPARMLPVARPPGYEQGELANELGMVAHLVEHPDQVIRSPRVSRPFMEGITFDLVSDCEDVMVPLSTDTLPEAYVEAAWRSALLNLEGSSLAPLAPTKTEGVFRGPWQNDYDASRLLLLPRLTDGYPLRGNPLIFVPLVAQVWVTGSDDLEGMSAILDAVDEVLASGEAITPYQFRQILLGHPWVFENQALRLWVPLPEHPLAGRIRALDERLSAKRRASAENVGGFARAVYGHGVPRREGQA